jgi:hypothetical protein
MRAWRSGFPERHARIDREPSSDCRFVTFYPNRADVRQNGAVVSCPSQAALGVTVLTRTRRGRL